MTLPRGTSRLSNDDDDERRSVGKKISEYEEINNCRRPTVPPVDIPAARYTVYFAGYGEMNYENGGQNMLQTADAIVVWKEGCEACS